MEDLLEELVGEIWDESDEVKSPVLAVNENVFLTYGDVSLNSLRRYFDKLLPAGFWSFLEIFPKRAIPCRRIILQLRYLMLTVCA